MAISAWTPLTLKYLCMYNVQKVLPAVYDDSLSYYELLAKMTLKEKIGQLNQASAPRNEADRLKQEEMMRRGEMGALILATSSTSVAVTGSTLPRTRSTLLTFFTAVTKSPSKISFMAARNRLPKFCPLRLPLWKR